MTADIKKKHSFHKLIEEYEYLKQYLGNKGILNDTTIAVTCDRLTLQECQELVRRVKYNFSLVSVVLKNKTEHEIATDVINLDEASRHTGAVFYTSYVVENFMHALTNLIFQSEQIKHIVFVNIPSKIGLSNFCISIRHNKSLTVLHLEDCDLRDDGCIQICQSLRRCPMLSLALVNCKITTSGVTWISWLIKEQSMIRKMAKWKPKSNNDPQPENRLQGIRKLNINDNPQIEDNGAKCIIDTLYDDNWVLHIHMQNTGITERSGVQILKLLHHNNVLKMFDVERNPITSNNLVSYIHLSLNSRHKSKIKKPTTACKKNKKKVVKKNKKDGTPLKNDSNERCETELKPCVPSDNPSFSNKYEKKVVGPSSTKHFCEKKLTLLKRSSSNENLSSVKANDKLPICKNDVITTCTEKRKAVRDQKSVCCSVMLPTKTRSDLRYFQDIDKSPFDSHKSNHNNKLETLINNSKTKMRKKIFSEDQNSLKSYSASMKPISRKNKETKPIKPLEKSSSNSQFVQKTLNLRYYSHPEEQSPSWVFQWPNFENNKTYSNSKLNVTKINVSKSPRKADNPLSKIFY